MGTFNQTQSFGIWAVLVGLFLTGLFRMALITPPKVETDHPFDTARTIQTLSRILGDERPHPVDSDANDAVRERLLSEIEALGFEPVVRDEFVCRAHDGRACARVQNVAFWVTAPGPDAIMLASHYDSVPTGPGAADDGMGVAVSLELARIVRDKIGGRPVLVLITDGEEMGLLGAKSFVETDPLAQQVGAIINIEARGVSGTANMFETSLPNGHDLNIFGRGEKRPYVSSLSADIYRAMPNGTDLTEFFALDVDAANFSFIGHPTFYHTPHDTIANLDPRSVYHIGRSTLDALYAYSGVDRSAAERNFIYGDILRGWIIKLPSWLSLPILALGVVLGGGIVWREKAASLWRAALYFPLVLLLSTGLAVGVSEALSVIRPEDDFAAAHPWALRGAQYGFGLLGALLVHRGLFKGQGAGGFASRFLAANWVWFCAVGTLATLFLPGAAILFVPAVMVMLLCAGLVLVKKYRFSAIFAWIGALLYGLLALPAAAMAETALFLEGGAPFIATSLILFTLLIPLVVSSAAKMKWSLLTLVGISAAFTLAALFVPAYSEDQPLGRSIIHFKADDAPAPIWFMSAQNPLPESFQSFGFAKAAVPRLSAHSWVTDAPDFNTPAPTLEIIRDQVEGAQRQITFRIDAPETDRVWWRAAGEVPRIDQMSVNGYLVDDDRETPMRGMTCYGRSCQTQTIRIDMPVSDAAITLDVHAINWGLGAESAALIKARPNWMVPQHRGDQRIHRVRFTLPPPN